ncbi:TPA: Rpn family recombination-promoting nuclease/putative transposase [Candidatus Ventrenecus stercoripullorum]|nr:Rpn family recombination-promoting nuclease/putative transposase [Candidatus Ventrenecus stercoripullorum]
MSKVHTIESLNGDLVFKEVFGTQKNVRFTEYLLELLKGYEKHSLKGKVTVLNEVFLDKTKLNDKGITSDVLAKSGDKVIDLEMYTTFEKDDFEKSLTYLTRIYGTRLEIGEKYQNQPKVTQYNFCVSSHISGINEFETDFLFMDRKTTNIISDKIEGYIYRLDKLDDVVYDDVRKEELRKIMKMIYAKTKEERLEIAKGSEILMDLAQVMEEFVNDEAVLKYKSLAGKNEEIARRNGRREGRKEGTQLERCNIAKNLLKDHLDINKIMQYTGLTKQEILRLQ